MPEPDPDAREPGLQEPTPAPQPTAPRRRKLSWLPLLLVVLLLVGGGVLFVAAENRDDAETNEAVPSRVTEVAERPRLSVRVVSAERAPIQSWVFAEGTARSVRREYLTFEATGRVTFVGPEKTGVEVEAGEVLATLDKRTFAADVDAALAAIREAETQVEASSSETQQAQTSATLAERQFERAQQLFRQNASSQAELDEAQANLENARAAVQAAQARARAIEANIAVARAQLSQAQVRLENAEIVSPIDGIVAYLNIEEGYYFTQNFVRTSSESEALATVPVVVIDPSQFEIIVGIPSFDASRIEVGQQVIVLPGGTTDAALLSVLEGETPQDAAVRPEWRATAEVYSVNPAVNPGGRSVQVRIHTTESADQLRDGMFVTCWIATQEKADAVVAPLNAFLYQENEPYVFVYQPETETVERRSVAFGIQGLSRREIARGVDAGEWLVTNGRYKLVDGAPVHALAPESAETSGASLDVSVEETEVTP